MLDAGAEVVETDTFQGSRLKLDEWGLGEQTLQINTSAAQIARRAAGEERFVAGSNGPPGHLPPSQEPAPGQIRLVEVLAGVTEQGSGPLACAGAPVLIQRPRGPTEMSEA